MTRLDKVRAAFKAKQTKAPDFPKLLFKGQYFPDQARCQTSADVKAGDEHPKFTGIFFFAGVTSEGRQRWVTSDKLQKDVPLKPRKTLN